jgi:F0F1-type ATP synthase membrane subunit b/b'
MNETAAVLVWAIVVAIVSLVIMFWVIRGAILSALREDRRRTAEAEKSAKLAAERSANAQKFKQL